MTYTYRLDVFDESLQARSFVLLFVLLVFLLLVPHLLQRGVFHLVGGVVLELVVAEFRFPFSSVQSWFAAISVDLLRDFGAALLEVHDGFGDLDVEGLHDDFDVVGTDEAVGDLVERIYK
mgnify:FL=1